MEAIIRTKKSYWEFSFRNGIRRANSLDWHNASRTMEALIAHQAAKAKEALEAPVFKAIEETVAQGVKDAVVGDKRWRASHNALWRQQAGDADTSLVPDDAELYPPEEVGKS